MNDRRLWRVEEDMIILELVKEHGCKKWTVIASEMARLCGQVSRTSKQIRERWHNHLDPQINKCPWSEDEERIIFEAHKHYGSKWKQIAKLLHARTDNSVKNHFYSTLRRSLRRINKYLGFKNSTNQMRVLKPSILSQLVESSQHNNEAKSLVERIFEFSTFKPSKVNMSTPANIMQQDDKIKYQLAIQKLVQFNNTYQKDKKICKGKISRKMISNTCNVEQNSPISTIAINQNEDNKAEFISDQSELPESNLNIQYIQNQQQSSWSVKSQKNAMLPDLEKPEKQYDFLESEYNHLQHHSNYKQEVCWLQANSENQKIDKQERDNQF